jgi:short-subunit dehydrogenase
MENDRKIMEINFFGVVALTKALLPHMIENGGGQLAAASSLVGKFGFPYRSAYSASKHALHGFFESVVAENYQHNIRISMLIGGRIRTNISKFAIDKSGREHGQMDAGQANGISPEKAAQQILKGLRKEKLEIPVGGKELLILKIKRFFPGWHSKLIRKINPM